MIIFFGYGYRSFKNFGPTIKLKCGGCKEETYWNLTRIKEWIHFYGIPVVPANIEYYLQCSECSYGIFIKSKFRRRVKKLNKLMSALLRNEISEEAYNKAFSACKMF